MKNILLIISLLIIIGGLWFFFGKGGSQETDLGGNTQVSEEGKKEDVSKDAQKPVMEETNGKNPIVVFKTSMGDVSLEIFADRMPITAANFMKLVKEDFYDGVKFHRVIDKFMIQGGDPNSKGENTASYGTGGPGYTIKDEFADGNADKRGTIAMANAGPNTGGSQFFINLVDNDFLNQKHPVFGKVIGGMDVVDAIGKTKTGERDLPVTPVVIKDIEVKE